MALTATAEIRLAHCLVMVVLHTAGAVYMEEVAHYGLVEISHPARCPAPYLSQVLPTQLQAFHMLAALVCLCPTVDIRAHTAHPDMTISEYRARTKWAVTPASLAHPVWWSSRPRMIITVVIVIVIAITTTAVTVVTTDINWSMDNLAVDDRNIKYDRWSR